MSNIEAHTFPDTNDNEVKRQIKNLKEKFIIHNQSDKAERVDYLLERFLKCKLKNCGGGFGQVHYSVIRMLFLLQNNPTSLESIQEFKNERVYLTREELRAIEDKKIEQQLKIKTEEDAVIDAIQAEWLSELQSSSDYSSDEDDDEFDDLEQDQESQEEIKEDQDLTTKLRQGDEATKERVQIKLTKGKREIDSAQVFFGGMPSSKIKAPLIKTVVKDKRSWQKKPKKFSINQFLDKYLQELKPPTLPYETYLEQKSRALQDFEKEKQERLKSVLGVRTFNELQNTLSKRVTDSELMGNGEQVNGQSMKPIVGDEFNDKVSGSVENPTLSSYIEPLNLLKDYAGKQVEEMGFWHLHTVTERQLLMDTILLLQQLESPTYCLTTKSNAQNEEGIGNSRRKVFAKRHGIQLKHLTPKTLETVVEQFISMANVLRETILYLQGLKNQQKVLGTVIESFVFKVDQILQRFTCELSDLQHIALLQAGQLSKKQLTLNSSQNSSIPKLIKVDEPLSLLKLHHIMENHLFKKVIIIHEIMRNGIMDYLIIEDDQNLLGHMMMIHEVDNSMEIGSQYRSMEHDKQFGELIPEIQVKKIKPADRVTFLLNYLYLVIKNNQLLANFAELNLLKEILISTMDPYINIISDWVNKGELKDSKQEFFIRPNPKIFDQASNSKNQEGQQKKASCKQQWKESFIFRTINLRELMGQGQEPFYLANDNAKVEISIPIFLRPVMHEILSLGKSIKIIRYLDKVNTVQDGFQEFQDFKAMYQQRLSQELSIIKPESDQFIYYDEDSYQPNQKLVDCANQNLQNIWDPSYLIGNIMNESQIVRNYRELLDVAPFQWSLANQESPSSLGIFQIPQIQKNLNNSFASTQFSETYNTPEKNQDMKLIDQPNRDVEMQSVHEDNNLSTPRNNTQMFSEQKSLINDDNYKKLSDQYNYSQQELTNYEGSMSYYQAYHTFDYLMKNPLDQSEQDDELNQNLRIYKFKGFTVENLIKECVTVPIRQIYSKTCSRFIQRLDERCKLQYNLKILRQIFFMEAGNQMHQYTTKIFKQMDRGRSIENLYMINGHFNECVCQNLKGVNFIERMSVFFNSDPKNYSLQSINALDYLSIKFKSEWPLEIILDKATISQYNLILQHLMRIHRVNYVLSLKDYWIKPIVNLKPYSEMNVKEQIMYQNKKMLDALLHQMQLFQKEILHFSNNLEYYLKTRAIQQVCNEFDIRLNEIQNDPILSSIDDDVLDTNSMIDMDSLVQIHQDFLMNILRLCLLDSKSKKLLEVVLTVLQIGLDFRELCLKYLLRGDSKYDYKGDSDDESSDKSQDDEDLQYGMGLLRIDNIKFVDRIEACNQELLKLKQKFGNYMRILVETLKKYRKKGVFSYLDEAFTRFNFNNYYLSRDREGLE